MGLHRTVVPKLLTSAPEYKYSPYELNGTHFIGLWRAVESKDRYFRYVLPRIPIPIFEEANNTVSIAAIDTEDFFYTFEVVYSTDPLRDEIGLAFTSTKEMEQYAKRIQELKEWLDDNRAW